MHESRPRRRQRCIRVLCAVDFRVRSVGLTVVQSWLKYRMKKGAGKNSSLLDDIRPERWTSQFITELLELLRMPDVTIESYPAQAALLETILASDCIRADELPAVHDHMHSPKKAKPATGDLFDFEE